MFGVGVGVRVGGRTPVGGSTYVGLLDTYPNAAAAYSVRLLRGGYTGNAIRVRRSSDNAEQNIGFTALGNLDTTALTSFCSGTNGFVTTWYDQSGNGRDATQTTATNQAQIVISGSVINVNSKPSLQFDGSNDRFLWAYQWANQPFDFFNVAVNSTTAFKNIIAEGQGTSGYPALGVDNVNRFYLGRTGQAAFPFFTSDATVNAQILSNFYSTLGISLASISCNFRKNNGTAENVIGSPFNNSNNQSTLGSAGNGDYWNGKIQEVILYSADKTTSRTGIATNINTYYGIY